MSFFDFETNAPIDRGAKHAGAEEDVAVYTWGDVSYDTLGSALQETGDDLNDETFGSGPVGKDFDFIANNEAIMGVPAPPPNRAQILPTSQPSRAVGHADPWATNNLAAALPKFGGTTRTTAPQPQRTVSATSNQAPSVFSMLDSAVPPSINRRQSQQQILTPSMLHAETSRQPEENSMRPRTMAEIEAEMQAALRQQLQQQELERMQAEREQEMLRQQLLQKEQHRIYEQEQARLREQQVLQDPLWAIRQAMMENNGMAPPSHEKRLSVGSGNSPLAQHRHAMPMPQAQLQGAQMNSMNSAQQQMILQELLFQQQQQQQQYREHHPHVGNQHGDMERNEPLVNVEAQRRIQEQELRHRRRMSKIQAMSKYNDLMTQSDKDFITRVQITQLITADPYADDFYAQVYASIKQQRNSVDSNVAKPGNPPTAGGGGSNQRGQHRRENAMQRMQAQVERMVNNMKSRELSKENSSSPAALQNVLGKTSGRSYKAAPRQLLQVAIASPDAQKAHPLAVKDHEPEKVSDSAHSHGKELPPPFSHTEALLIIEHLFSNILDIEQLRRNKPPPEDASALEAWNAKLQESLGSIWKGLRVSGPLYETNPHPFIAIITPLKGKRFIGRLGRDLTDDQKLMALSVIINRIEQVDVIQNAAIFDIVEDSRDRRLAEKQAYAFQEHVVNQGLQLSPATRTLKTYNALIEMMIESGATFARVVRTRPGLILLEHFFAEAILLKHGVQEPDGELISAPPEDVAKWTNLYDRLFENLLPLWNIMFPSSRILPTFAPESLEALQVSLVTDGFDQHVWRFLAGFALEGTQEQHSRLVTQLRTKVMGTLKLAQRLDEGKAKARKIRNVDLFLNALGLSSSQIPV